MEGIQGTVEIQVDKVLVGKVNMDNLGHKGEEEVVEFSLDHKGEEGEGTPSLGIISTGDLEDFATEGVS